MRTRRLAVFPLLPGLILLLPAVGTESAEAQNVIQCTSGCVGVRVTPDGGSLEVATNSTGNVAVFNLANTGQVLSTYTLTCSATGNATCGTVTPSTIGMEPNTETDINVTFSAGAIGSGRITLSASGGGTDAGFYFVTIGTPGAPMAALRNYNRDNLERSLCLTTGAGESAADVCGDLVVTHSMPGYTTLGRERALTLIYNSRTAYYRPIVTVAATEGGSILRPSNVLAELQVPAGTVRRSVTYPGWGGSTPSTRQIAISYDAPGHGHPSGIYPFRLRLQNQYTSQALDAIVNDTLIVVNRLTSRFGAGFWIAGLEQLVLAQPGQSLLWIGGDGSARMYRPAGSNLWVAPLGAFRDTISYNPTASEYTRSLRHGVKVVFDMLGRHVRTVSRTQQQTTFSWAADTLKSISVPPAGQGGTYLFFYDAAGKLDRIVDPANRTLDVAVVSGRLTQIIDPDGRSTGFGYDADSKMVVRTNRRSINTLYVYGNTHRLTRVTIPAGAAATDTATAVIQYQPWDEKGLFNGAIGGLPEDTSLAYTRILGPRFLAGVPGDTAAIRVDRWGAPTRIVNALGATTTLLRGDAANPAQPTKVTYPSGRVVNMTYNARGNLTSVQDVNSGMPTRTTTYVYLAASLTPDSPDTVRDALGRKTRYVYNSMGLTDLVVDPRGHQTKFFYLPSGDALAGMIDNIAERAVVTWRQSDFGESTRDQVQGFSYDLLGNLKTSTAPTGVRTSYTRDASGRVIGIYDPLGTRRSHGYDPMNRMVRDSQFTAKQTNPYGLNSLAGCDATQLSCGDTLPATLVPALPAALVTQYLHGPLGLDSIADPRLVKRGFKADLRELPRQETDEFGATRTANYDRGGLLTSSVSRSNVTVRYRYDAAGRRTAMVYPLQDYSGGCQPTPSCRTALQVPGDSVSYSYDISDNLLVVKNAGSTISRTYYPDGSLKQKISVVGTLVPDTLMYEYDAAGALSKVIHGRDVRDTTVYGYNAAGDLATLDFSGAGLVGPARRFVFVHDGLGRRRQITYPNGAVVIHKYDAGGMLREVASNRPGAANLFNVTWRREQVNPAGLITREVKSCPSGLTFGDPCNHQSPLVTLSRYNRLGMLVRQQVAAKVDSMGYDASGNMMFRRNGTDLHTFSMMAASNRMQTDALGQMNFSYTGDGNRDIEYSSTSAYSTRFYYYDGLGRMTGTWHFIDNGSPTPDPHNNATACRFDADGQITNPCDNGAPQLAYDGNNVITTRGFGPNGSSWRFVHGPGTDDPLLGWWRSGNGVNKLYFWVTDGQGRQLTVADSVGVLTQDDMTIQFAAEGGGKYAGGTGSANSFDADRFSTPEMPGLSLFRNRAYDQRTGRWTQEDPIGVAGGLNLYQFNGNNPVTYTDPFGLCVPWCTALLGAAIGGGGAAIATVAYNALHDQPLTQNLGRNTLIGASGGAAIGLGYGLLSGGGATATTLITGGAAAGRVPFEGFQKWGREAVGWGKNAAGAIRAAAEMTAEKAASLDPAKVQAAKEFYEKAVAGGKGGAAAPARVELMERIIDLQK